jgi:hypothetical protein
MSPMRHPCMSGGLRAARLAALALTALVHVLRADEAPLAVDVCVYGGTASGIAAAVAARREGRSVVVVEPSRWLGGMTGGGIRVIDWGRPGTIGGLARAIFADGKDDPYYRALFAGLLRQHAIPVIYEHRLAAVRREGARITALILDYAPPDRYGTPAAAATAAAARTVLPRVVIDASYEGDAMARAGVAYAVGREARSAYGEPLAGVRPPLSVYAIDPYVRPGDPASGLLPMLQDAPVAAEGDADRQTMAYCFRWKLSEAPDRLPFGEPERYDPAWYEVLRRGFAGGIDMAAGRRMRRLGEYDAERGSFFSGNSSRALIAMSVAGSNRGYPDGDWATRARIWAFHREYVRGLMRFLQTDPAVPQDLRQRAARTGLQHGLFDETAGWPHQLYVREARRMIGAYVLTQHDLEGATAPDDPIGLGSYGIDDWPYATVARDGKVALQGGEFSILRLGGPHDGIYPIPYRCLTPRATECSNLLVPVCLSASHIAMTSTRMEPVWTVVGESAGTAAALACAGDTDVQAVPYPALRARLLAAGQRLDPESPAGRP